MSGMLPAVAQAIEEIRCTFEGCGVEAEADGSGGAFVVATGDPAGVPLRAGGSLDRFPDHLPVSVR